LSRRSVEELFAFALNVSVGRIELVRNSVGDSGRLSPMSVSIPRLARSEIVYPDSDGKPIADNTLQFRWIVTIKEGLDWVFQDQPPGVRRRGPALVSDGR
jgi:hypothetical protein